MGSGLAAARRPGMAARGSMHDIRAIRENPDAFDEGLRPKDGARAEALKAEVAALKDGTPALEAEEREASAALEKAVGGIPNLPNAEVPVGEVEHDNVEKR